MSSCRTFFRAGAFLLNSLSLLSSASTARPNLSLSRRASRFADFFCSSVYRSPNNHSIITTFWLFDFRLPRPNRLYSSRQHQIHLSLNMPGKYYSPTLFDFRNRTLFTTRSTSTAPSPTRRALHIVVCLLLLFWPSVGVAQNPAEDITETNPKQAAAAEAKLLTRTRQLTFAGRRAGEGYFNADGSEMVFQSERESGNPFFQIYVMGMETGDIEKISPGYGKTTCAWLHPTKPLVLYASTQLDPLAKTKQQEELALRASGKERRYSWDYDETYDLIQYDRKAKRYLNLTNVRGYDAEGSYSPDGKWIVFASNRRAYSHPMNKRV